MEGKATTHADRVRDYARREYVEPARRRHESTICIAADEVQKAMKLGNRVSVVCHALKSHKFLDENHLVLEQSVGPPSGKSATVIFTYRLLRATDQPSSQQGESPFLRLRGIAKEIFQSVGGGEAFIRKEREAFYE
jgi:hypothetical protein